jgi:hypothetical protein
MDVGFACQTDKNLANTDDTTEFGRHGVGIKVTYDSWKKLFCHEFRV